MIRRRLGLIYKNKNVNKRGWADFWHRFWTYLERRNNGCWDWAGTINYGYGRLRKDGGKVYAHKIMWEVVNGPVPNGLFVLHKCDNRKCCNPDHLFLGTISDNNHDAKIKGRKVMGMRSKSAKLTDSDVRQIIVLRDSGFKVQEIATIYKVSGNSIRAVFSGKCWRHITGIIPVSKLPREYDLVEMEKAA